MTAPTESPVDLDLPSVDTSPACEGHPPSGPEATSTGCDRPAQLRVRYFHVTDHPSPCEVGVVFLLCNEHFARSLFQHRDFFDRFADTQIVCDKCRETITCIHDIIGTVVPL